jgi:hypothetical protein
VEVQPRFEITLLIAVSIKRNEGAEVCDISDRSRIVKDAKHPKKPDSLRLFLANERRHRLESGS